MTPTIARLRNLNYESDLYLDCKLKVVDVDEEAGTSVTKEEDRDLTRVILGKVPIMVHSDYCVMKKMKTDEEIIQAGECIHDQGGYFVINGSEKVVVAQEKMADNFVYVFHSKPPSKFSWVA
mmetsp:Transcript_25512/g.22519  ORF Transcript_25512/g.22519 Transcript_25512/m.22519 type:complete len:122 (-) Transcript_25512:2205-2570(-)